MRRRFMRGLRFRGGGNRLLSRAEDVAGLGLRDVQPLERVPGTPDGIAIGTARRDGQRVALAVGTAPGAQLVGWSLVAGAVARNDPRAESIAIAPLVDTQMRHAAAAMARRGIAVRVVALPSLADRSDDTWSDEAFPERAALPLLGAPAAGVLDRVLRVLEGAAAVCGDGGIRRAPGGYLLYLRGAPVARIAATGDGVVVVFQLPERDQVQVSGAGLSDAMRELHAQVVRVGGDSRLLESGRAEREREVDAAISESGARAVGRWLPWSDDGFDPIDWVGVGANGRPVLGLVRSTFGLGDVPGLIAGLAAFEGQRDAWTPGVAGVPVIQLSANDVEPRAGEMLQTLGLGAPESEDVAGAAERFDEDRSSRRGRGGRSRRRRRGGYDQAEGGDAEEGASESADDRQGTETAERSRASSAETANGSGDDASEAGERSGSRRRGRRRRGRRSGRSEGDEGRPDEGRPDEGLSASTARDQPQRERDRRPDRETERGERGERGAGDAPPAEPDARQVAGQVAGEVAKEVSEEVTASAEADDAVAKARGDVEPAEPPEPSEQKGAIESEVEAVLAEDSDDDTQQPMAEEPKPEPRPRRSRAAIVTSDDPDDILAGLVLARERRSVVLFWVCPQESLIDFLKGRATDLPDNVDLLLVGFTALPIPSQTIEAAELFKGRLQWFDHHEWPVEDLEQLRQAIGEDAVEFHEGGGSALAAIAPTTERRSRFTDKLVDLSARRLAESEMEKWGYRVARLLRKLADSPGDHRPAIGPILSGKPAELPSADDVFAAEREWVKASDPRIVHFGEYQMVVLHVPRELDAAETGRQARLHTGARLSFATREGDPTAIIGCNEEKRHISVMDLVDHIDANVSWAHAQSGGDRLGRIVVDDLARHPERRDLLIGEIVRNKSILYG